jgi:hypothetical protein
MFHSVFKSILFAYDTGYKKKSVNRSNLVLLDSTLTKDVIISNTLPYSSPIIDYSKGPNWPLPLFVYLQPIIYDMSIFYQSIAYSYVHMKVTYEIENIPI